MAAFTGTYNHKHLARLFESWGGQIPAALKERFETPLPEECSCERLVVTPTGRVDEGGDPLFTVEYHDLRPMSRAVKVIN